MNFGIAIRRRVYCFSMGIAVFTSLDAEQYSFELRLAALDQPPNGASVTTLPSGTKVYNGTFRTASAGEIFWDQNGDRRKTFPIVIGYCPQAGLMKEAFPESWRVSPSAQLYCRADQFVASWIVDELQRLDARFQVSEQRAQEMKMLVQSLQNELDEAQEKLRHDAQSVGTPP